MGMYYEIGLIGCLMIVHPESLNKRLTSRRVSACIHAGPLALTYVHVHVRASAYIRVHLRVCICVHATSGCVPMQMDLCIWLNLLFRDLLYIN